MELAITILLALAGPPQWTGPDGGPLPFANETEVEAFLRTAEVVSRKELEGSHNRPERLVLRAHGVEARAVFRTVDKKKRSARVGDVTIRDFHDSYVYECAAYQLSLVLGIAHVPPCVLRTIDGRRGSVQLWIEDAVTEVQHRYNQDGPRASSRWPEIFETMAIFDALIDNFDRHAGNVLVDARDRVWFIDHTRSFRLYTNAPLEGIERCNPALASALSRMERGDLDRLRPYVSVRHIEAVWRRRGQLAKHLSCDARLQASR